MRRENSYHGFTLGAQSISWNPKVGPYEPYLMSHEHINIKISCAYSHRFKRDDETEIEYGQRLILDLKKKYCRE